MVVGSVSLAALQGCGQVLQHHCCLACDPPRWWVASSGLRHISPVPAGKSPKHQEFLLVFLPYFSVRITRYLVCTLGKTEQKSVLHST